MNLRSVIFTKNHRINSNSNPISERYDFWQKRCRFSEPHATTPISVFYKPRGFAYALILNLVIFKMLIISVLNY
jgi:hypothetical protein